MTKKIVEHLKKKYNAQAIILHGSRARGKERVKSDWDVFLFVSKPLSVQSELFEGAHLDITPVHLPIKTDDFVDTYGQLLGSAKVLLDTKDKLASKVLSEVKKFWSHGKTLKPSELTNIRNYMQRVLWRMEDNAKEQGVFFYHLSNFYQGALLYWFQTKGKWPVPVYEALPIIKKEQLAYYKHLQILNGSSAIPKKVSSAKKLFELLFFDKGLPKGEK